MDIILLWIVCYLLLGGVVGFMAGLLGIGGGGLMVPILTSLFLLQGIHVEQVLHLALGTSMTAIVVTSFSSMMAHHKKGTVQWQVVKKIIPGVILGTFLTTFVVALLNTLYLSVFFAIFMAYVSIQMFISKRPNVIRSLPSTLWVSFAGFIIGALSAMASIGGGSLSVPYMTWHNIELKKAISTSAAIGFPLSVVGTLGYMINGVSSDLNLPFTVGFINLPAALSIAVVSFFIAPLGARVAHRISTAKLKKIFAVLLLGLSLKMVSAVLFAL